MNILDKIFGKNKEAQSSKDCASSIPDPTTYTYTHQPYTNSVQISPQLLVPPALYHSDTQLLNSQPGQPVAMPGTSTGYQQLAQGLGSVFSSSVGSWHMAVGSAGDEVATVPQKNKTKLESALEKEISILKGLK